MEEIIDAIVFQLESSDCMEKLTAGIVITGGGSQLRHLPQLIKYRTGLDVRIGMPNVNVNNAGLKEVNHPMYSTSVGLLYKGFENKAPVTVKEQAEKEPEPEVATVKEEPVAATRHTSRLSNIIGSFKNTIENIFDDDTE
jgi:cell division protein FtsA